MPNLPDNEAMTGFSVTQGQFRARMNDFLGFCRDVFGSTGTVASVRSALGLQAMALRSAIGTDDLEAEAVTTAKIAPGAITPDRLAAGALLPPGVMVDFGGTTPPAGWLLCDGAAISRITYAALFAAIGTTWGAGDGSTSFNVPDFRGRARAGRDDMGGVAAGRLTNTGLGSPGLDGTILGATGGIDRLTLLEAQMPAHAHAAWTDTQGVHTHTGYTDAQGIHNHGRQSGGAAGFGNAGGWGGLAFDAGPADAGNHAHNVYTYGSGNHAHNVGVDLRGSSQPHPNLQPTAIVNVMIKI